MYDENQSKAIRHFGGACLTIAGPGAGKTYVLTKRITQLVRHYGVPPEEILVITFTNAAAKEMQRRYRSEPDTTGGQVSFGTFHSIYYSILKENHISNSLNIIDEKTKRHLIASAAEAAGVDIMRIPEAYQRLLGAFSAVKNKGKTTDDITFYEISKEKLHRIYYLYEKQKRELDRIDFDDILTYTYKLLSEREDILAKYRRRYRYFLVDEVQDMNRVQFDVLRLLAAPLNNIFMVGDDDQAIYSFRGADSRLMLDFKSYYPDGDIITLNKNFRSCGEIIKASNNLISHNNKRYLKDYQKVRATEGKIRYISFYDSEGEARWLAEAVKNESRTYPDKTIGILYRTHRQSILIRRSLHINDVAYFGYKKDEADDNEFISDIRDYFLLCTKGIRRDVLLRVMNKPKRYLPRSGLIGEIPDFKAWMDYHEDVPDIKNAIASFSGDIDNMRRMPSFGVLTYIIKKCGYEKYAIGKDEYGYKKAIEYLTEIAKKNPDKIRFLESISNRKSEDKSTLKSNIFLYTFHGSKGLEFDHVYIMDVNDGVTPSKFSDTDELIQEERRMFYVAMTRAKNDLTLISIKRMGSHEAYPSVFLKEIKESDITRLKAH